MRYLITASILNVILDLWFIAGLHMGVGGAAFATIISQTVSAGLAFRKLTLTKEAYGVRWHQVRFHPPPCGPWWPRVCPPACRTR